MPMPRILKILLGFLFLCLFGASFILVKEIGRAAVGESTAPSEEVQKLNAQIEDTKKRLKEIQDQQAIYSQSIRTKQNEQANLSNELAIIDNRTKKAELDMAQTQTEIDRTGLEIQKTELEIKDAEDQIQAGKDNIGKILRLVYKKDDVTSLEVLLLNDSFSEFLNQIKYLEDVNSKINDAVSEVKEKRENLEKVKLDLAAKNTELEAQKKTLEGQKQSLAVEYDNKNYLLDQTRSSEAEFQRLLKQAKKEQQAAAADISSLEKTIRQKMSAQDTAKLDSDGSAMAWPVPKNVITAIFHDPDYPFRYIFEHPADDIRARQGTPIKAAASGYVARAKNGGMGYSYIMLIHGDGLSTVYGHVSKIYVEEDEYVAQGQVIGLSGGMPGTPGAGPLTTGPHLHFEVRLNGIPVNPLAYLP